MKHSIPATDSQLFHRNKRKPLTTAERYAILKRDNFTCQLCGRTATETGLDVDHIKPVVDGGTNSPENLRTTCWLCNNGRANLERPRRSLYGAQYRFANTEFEHYTGKLAAKDVIITVLNCTGLERYCKAVLLALLGRCARTGTWEVIVTRVELSELADVAMTGIRIALKTLHDAKVIYVGKRVMGRPSSIFVNPLAIPTANDYDVCHAPDKDTALFPLHDSDCVEIGEFWLNPQGQCKYRTYYDPGIQQVEVIDASSNFYHGIFCEQCSTPILEGSVIRFRNHRDVVSGYCACSRAREQADFNAWLRTPEGIARERAHWDGNR